MCGVRLNGDEQAGYPIDFGLLASAMLVKQLLEQVASPWLFV